MCFEPAVVATRFSVKVKFSFLLIKINQMVCFNSAMQGYVIKQKILRIVQRQLLSS